MQCVFRLSWVILFLALAPAYAEIYKWVDRDGRVHFSDTLAGIPSEYRDHIEEKPGLTAILCPYGVTAMRCWLRHWSGARCVHTSCSIPVPNSPSCQRRQPNAWR